MQGEPWNIGTIRLLVQSMLQNVACRLLSSAAQICICRTPGVVLWVVNAHAGLLVRCRSHTVT